MKWEARNLSEAEFLWVGEAEKDEFWPVAGIKESSFDNCDVIPSRVDMQQSGVQAS